jgi:LEA14-like dessication related protein
MNYKNLLIGGLLVAGVFYFIGKKKLAKAIRFSIEKISFSGTKIILKLGLLNPTGNEAKFNSMVADVFVKGNQVATLTTFQTVKIAPNSKSAIDIQITPTGIGILSSLRTLLSKGGLKNLQARVKGTANVDGVAFPIDITYSA